MDAPLTPREIQAQIRAGQTVDDLAVSSGMARADIEPFAAPVIAERAYIADQASHGQVRRAGVSAHQTLADLVSDRLASRGLTTALIDWDAWRGTDRLWTVRASYRSGSALHEAVFRYDPVGRFSTAVNDEARWLIGETTSAHGPQPGRRNPPRDVDAEPTVDLSVTRNLRAGNPATDPPDQAGLFAFDPDGYSPVRLTEVDGVYDLVSDPSEDLDVLYDMLASINEDSVRIYEGLTATDDRPGTQAKPAKAAAPKPSASHPAPRRATAKPKAEAPAAPATEAPPADEAKEPAQHIPKSKKRATVPTWDEIMFGSPQGR